jgi:hypothetical protein
VLDSVSEFWHDLAARPTGPLAMRFYLQPLMATLFALRDGFKDARNDKPPYFWALFTHAERRSEMLRHGWKSVGKIFVLAAVLDIIYQLLVLHELHPLQTAVVAATLAILPYLIFRGPVNRIVRRLR